MTEAPPSTAPPDDQGEEETVAQARRQIVSRGEDVTRAEAARAIRRLETLEHGTDTDLDPEVRAVVHDLAATLTTALLVVPLQRLADGEDGAVDEEVVGTALDLFGSEESHRF